MMNSVRVLRNKIFRKELLPAVFIVLNTFVWYLLTYLLFSNIISTNVHENQRLDLFTAYFVGIAATAIIGSKISPRARGNLLNVWLFLGVIATFLLTMISADNFIINALIVTFFGASIGLGLPSCLSYFAKTISIEKRGLISGTIWSTVGFTVFAFAFLTILLGALNTIIVLTVWRLIGAVGFLFLNRTVETTKIQKSPSYFMLFRKKELLLYLIPWVMFSFINFAEAPMLGRFFGEQQLELVQFLEFAFIGVFAFIGGLVADIGGRKRVIIAGFVMLGIEYATLSAFSNSSNALLMSYVFMTLDGITWGLLFSVFLTVIWGDLGENYEKEKLYAIGGIPFLLSQLLILLNCTLRTKYSTRNRFHCSKFLPFCGRYTFDVCS